MSNFGRPDFTSPPGFSGNIAIAGIGAVSPAGWGVPALSQALVENQVWPTSELTRPGWTTSLAVRPVPGLEKRPPHLAHARLRRTSSVSQFAVAAALEALGSMADEVRAEKLRLGVVLCVMSGCVNYSRRFYDEVLREPATASPLVFPETVFNAPASHLAALLGTRAINYTLVGDPGTFLQGVALGTGWLLQNEVDACVVVGAEEIDWLTADAYQIFNRAVVLSEGAGAVCLRRAQIGAHEVTLKAITSSHNYSRGLGPREACRRMRDELLKSGRADILCDGTQGEERLDRPELIAWKGWQGERLSPKNLMGEGLAAASAWQCVAAIEALIRRGYGSAYVSVVGCNQQAIGAHFARENAE